MTLHKEGHKIIANLALAALVFSGLSYILAAPVVWIPVTVILFSLLFLTVYFFRIPNRAFEKDETKLMSPADGTIVAIEETEEKLYFKKKMLQVSIFMSPFNVHVNRYPASGEVVYTKHEPGKYLVAFDPKSSEENERTSIVLKMPDGKEILLRQVAGAVARRIVTYSQAGDTAEQGKDLGFIKFGSRVDIFLPIGTELLVELGDKLKSKKSFIARMS